MNAPSRITDPAMQAMSSEALASLGPHPVVILAGGTGGHIFPGLAVARALRARDVPVLWLGSAGGMETRLVPVDRFAIETIQVRGLRGKGIASLLSAPFVLLRSVWQALRVLRARKPRAVLSFGGFAAGPGGLAAWLLRRPLLVHEQNRAPGLTNRVLARLARRVLTGFPGSFAGRKEEAVGNPVRAEIAALAPPAERFQGREGALRLLVLGGSQGARAINETVPRIAAMLRKDGIALDIRHQCGEKLLDDARAAYAKADVAATVEPFIRDMAQAYGWADLVIGRAGALTIAELCAAGVGSLLVPFPGAVDDHQARNAEYLAERGGGEWFRQDGKLEAALRERVRAFAGDRAALLRVAEAARAAAFPQAADRVAAIVIEEAAHA
jgi:UDP-N-acetylglucosamine--N-acetylmuramyl-(pentapeptide) pyrophosphoryl-undecaprenol N-acetylglucosamine transferase